LSRVWKFGGQAVINIHNHRANTLAGLSAPWLVRLESANDPASCKLSRQ
jgi:hypothetical protein